MDIFVRDVLIIKSRSAIQATYERGQQVVQLMELGNTTHESCSRISIRADIPDMFIEVGFLNSWCL